MIFVLILIITIIAFILTNNKEHYDTRIDGSRENQCGVICTKTLGCNAFSYDDKKKICYLSNDELNGKPDKKLFGSFYNKKFHKCNKLEKIDDALYNTREQLINNATYKCYKNNDDKKPITKIYDNEQKEKSDGEVAKYTFEKIDWGNIINLDENQHLVTNPTKTNSVNAMREYDKEFMGQYRYPHKCSTNISKKDCLKSCLDDELCIGTEYNPYILEYIDKPNKYVIRHGVCCPKIKINKIVDRLDKHKYGRFYMKENILKKDIKDDDIVVLFDSNIEQYKESDHNSIGKKF